MIVQITSDDIKNCNHFSTKDDAVGLALQRSGFDRSSIQVLSKGTKNIVINGTIYKCSNKIVNFILSCGDDDTKPCTLVFDQKNNQVSLQK